MTALIVIIVFFLDRFVWTADSLREHRWFDRYLERVLHLPLPSNLMTQTWSALVVLAPLVLLIVWLEGLLSALFGEFAAALANAAVLLFSLGPRELGRAFADYQQAQQNGDTEQAEQLADSFCQTTECPGSEQQRVAAGILLAACLRLVGPAVYFLAFGAAGAAAYRLSDLLRLRLAVSDDPKPSLQQSAAHIERLFNWVPARLTAAGFALAGSFDGVAEAWKHYDPQHDAGTRGVGIVQLTGQAALHEPLTAVEQEAPDLERHLGMVWRSLGFWALLLAAAAWLSW